MIGYREATGSALLGVWTSSTSMKLRNHRALEEAGGGVGPILHISVLGEVQNTGLWAQDGTEV